MITGPLLFNATAAMLASLLAAWTAPRVWLIATLAGAGAALGAAVVAPSGGTDWEWRSGFTVGGELLHVRLDGISALFLVLLCVVGGAASVYVREYWSEETHPQSARQGRVWWSAMLFSLGSVLLVSNGLHFLIAWELFTLSAYFLITLNRQRLAPRGLYSRRHGLHPFLRGNGRCAPDAQGRRLDLRRRLHHLARLS